MDLEVQEDKILSKLTKILSAVLGLSYILAVPMMIVIMLYSIYKKYNYRFQKIYIVITVGLITSIYYKNFLGIFVSTGLYAFFYISYITKLIDYKITIKYTYYMALIEICIFLMSKHRSGVISFFNPNYYAAFLALLIVFYYYKRYDFKYLIVFLIALITTGSRFAIISLMFSYTLILFFEYKLIGFVVFLVEIMYVYLVYIGKLPFIRGDSIKKYLSLRLWIYYLGYLDIKESPLFGKGPFNFYKFSNYVYPHSHNIIIELINSYGILVFMYLLNMLRSIKFSKKKIVLLSLILTHGLMDYTIFWPQIALLFLVLFIDIKE